MSKQKKKRNKRYQGADAKDARPTVIRVDAVQRSKSGQWWHENKRRFYTAAATGAVVLVIGWLLIELFRLVFGG